MKTIGWNKSIQKSQGNIMTDKKLRKLNKTELLWIIRDQQAEIEELKAEILKLGGEIDSDKETASDEESSLSESTEDGVFDESESEEQHDQS